MQNELFLLVTDAGFLEEPRIVWETLQTVNGDSWFVDAAFHTVPNKPEHLPLATSGTGDAAYAPAPVSREERLKQEQSESVRLLSVRKCSSVACGSL